MGRSAERSGRVLEVSSAEADRAQEWPRRKSGRSTGWLSGRVVNISGAAVLRKRTRVTEHQTPERWSAGESERLTDQAMQRLGAEETER